MRKVMHYVFQADYYSCAVAGGPQCISTATFWFVCMCEWCKVRESENKSGSNEIYLKIRRKTKTVKRFKELISLCGYKMEL